MNNLEFRIKLSQEENLTKQLSKVFLEINKLSNKNYILEASLNSNFGEENHKKKVNLNISLSMEEKDILKDNLKKEIKNFVDQINTFPPGDYFLYIKIFSEKLLDKNIFKKTNVDPNKKYTRCSFLKALKITPALYHYEKIKHSSLGKLFKEKKKVLGSEILKIIEDEKIDLEKMFPKKKKIFFNISNIDPNKKYTLAGFCKTTINRESKSTSKKDYELIKKLGFDKIFKKQWKKVRGSEIIKFIKENGLDKNPLFIEKPSYKENIEDKINSNNIVYEKDNEDNCIFGIPQRINPFEKYTAHGIANILGITIERLRNDEKYKLLRNIIYLDEKRGIARKLRGDTLISVLEAMKQYKKSSLSTFEVKKILYEELKLPQFKEATNLLDYLLKNNILPFKITKNTIVVEKSEFYEKLPTIKEVYKDLKKGKVLDTNIVSSNLKNEK